MPVIAVKDDADGDDGDNHEGGMQLPVLPQADVLIAVAGTTLKCQAVRSTPLLPNRGVSIRADMASVDPDNGALGAGRGTCHCGQAAARLTTGPTLEDTLILQPVPHF